MSTAIDTAGAFVTKPNPTGQWSERLAISSTRDWSSTPWIDLGGPDDVVIQDFFWATNGGLRIYARDADARFSWRIYERLMNNRDAHASARVTGNGGPVQMFGNGTTQTRGELAYGYFVSGQIVLERRTTSPQQWHGSFEIFTQANYHRGTITTLNGCTGIAFTSTAAGLAYGNMTTRGWSP